MANTSRQTKKYILPTHFIPEDIKKRAERLMKEPYIIEIEPEIQEYLNKIQSETDCYRVLTTIAICEEFTHGIYSLEKCCKYQGIDCSTFYRWRKKLGALNTLFKKSQKKRKKSITETEVDDYHTTLRLLAMGFYYEVVTTIYDIYQDITGKVFKIPKIMRITKKYHPPNLKAAIFGLINRAPKKWKLYPSFEQKLQSKKKADDDFAGWTPKQILDWLEKNDPNFGNYTTSKA